MPIHIHLSNNTTTPIFTITDELYDTLASSFTTLEKKTSTFIDPYGDARLSHQHAELLLKIINEEVANKPVAVTAFTNFLEQMIREQTDIMLIGD